MDRKGARAFQEPMAPFPMANLDPSNPWCFKSRRSSYQIYCESPYPFSMATNSFSPVSLAPMMTRIHCRAPANFTF